MRREVLILVAAVLLVDGLFLAAYFLLGFNRAGDGARLGFTGAWTVASLLAVLVGLARVRRARIVTGGRGRAR